MPDTQKNNIGFGLVLIAFGALFLIDNLGLLPFDFRYYIFSWKGVLIIIGSILVATKSNRTAGFVLVAVGLFFMIPDIFHLPRIRWQIFWPTVLIILGFVYIIRQRGHNTAPGQRPDGTVDFIDDTNIFGGGEIVNNSQNFKGGKITAVFGGSNYNLSQAKLSDGNNVLDFFAMFGGGTFIVPADWDVNVDVTSIFGGFTDKRIPKLNADSAAPRRTLYLKGTVLFGGGEIRSY